jgi:catalase
LKEPNAFWDLLSNNLASIHQVTILFTDRGTPASSRKMDGFCCYTLKFVDANGKFKYIKIHFTSKQGKENVTVEEGGRLAGDNPDFLTQDLFQHIEKGGYLEWTVSIQVMEPEDKDKVPFDIFDITKTWSKKQFPLHPVGRFVLNKNPDNYFCETEQSVFSPSNIVPGIDVTADKMLQDRLFSYPDTQRYRLGANFLQLPINRPIVRVVNHQRGGSMAFENPGGRLNYPDSNLEDAPPKTLQQSNPQKIVTHAADQV